VSLAANANGQPADERLKKTASIIITSSGWTGAGIAAPPARPTSSRPSPKSAASGSYQRRVTAKVLEDEAREQQRKTVREVADQFLRDYELKHESPTFAKYALGHFTDHLGDWLVVEITPTVKRYQAIASRKAPARRPSTTRSGCCCGCVATRET
jgi:hypothetical protein